MKLLLRTEQILFNLTFPLVPNLWIMSSILLSLYEQTPRSGYPSVWVSTRNKLDGKLLVKADLFDTKHLIYSKFHNGSICFSFFLQLLTDWLHWWLTFCSYLRKNLCIHIDSEAKPYGWRKRKINLHIRVQDIELLKQDKKVPESKKVWYTVALFNRKCSKNFSPCRV